MNNNYFDNENRQMPHGVMFHHFHDDGGRPYAQGSITSEQFQQIIEYIGPKNILPANTWLVKAIKNELLEKEVCITFDDSLKCQIEIAYPVLQKFGISAFWFIFSSVFEGKINRLEIYRYFCNTYFSDFDAFYEIFKKYLLESQIGDLYQKNLNKFLQSNYLIEFDFYSDKEREFRFYRDKILNRKEFENIMDNILADNNIDINKISKNLWMTNRDLVALNSKDHIIGLHSFTHPTNMAQLDINKQHQEYIKNKEHILSVTSKDPITVSHPCCSYDKFTLKILDQLGIKIGFRSNFQKLNHSLMEFPRVDHSHILSELT